MYEAEYDYNLNLWVVRTDDEARVFETLTEAVCYVEERKQHDKV